MKKIFFALVFLGNFLFAQNVSVVPKVDERVELMSIVFRLAEAEEYVNNDLLYHSEEVDDYFFEYKDHPIVGYTQEIRALRGIGYDAVMSFAAHIKIDGTITFIDNVQENSLESRWTKENADTFLKHLNDFYTTSRFNDFFNSYADFYQKAETNFTKVLNMVDFSWFEKFYGVKATGEYSLIISMLNGGNNYGATVKHLNGDNHIYAMIGSWRTDSLGYPDYSDNVLSLIIHEYNHSFCNPLIDKYYKKMQKNAEKSFSEVASIMNRQAYSNAQIMLYEMLVRACVIRYQIKDHEDEKKATASNWFSSMEKGKGFLWIDQLVDLLDKYENNRDKYPALDKFMPEVVKLSNGIKMQKLQKEYDANAPKILGTNIENKATDVDPNITGITVKFDRPMYTGGYGTSYGSGGESFYPESHPEKKPEWNMETKKEITFYFILKPDTEYSISFPGQFFYGENLQQAQGMYYLDFRTRKE